MPGKNPDNQLLFCFKIDQIPKNLDFNYFIKKSVHDYNHRCIQTANMKITEFSKQIIKKEVHQLKDLKLQQTITSQIYENHASTIPSKTNYELSIN